MRLKVRDKRGLGYFLLLDVGVLFTPRPLGALHDCQLGTATVNWKQRTLRFSAPHSGDLEYRVFTLCPDYG